MKLVENNVCIENYEEDQNDEDDHQNDEDDEDDDDCPPTIVKTKKDCPTKEDFCPSQDIDPCTLDKSSKKKRKKGKDDDDCEEEKTCANPITPKQRERLKREHLELCKAFKQPTCAQTAAKKSKDPC
ncbi:unnamed protein product [Spodoptera littoralis]|uniref:Uncharacterized protein n=1 Tax=Spodoptera littoralis TaxID=7109 RepID=A0A9P0N3Y0_SPOLI|nr:unnamed protein product [Spodoptera littoralis]CAH1643847.1 unnamed protein product [Spodoptera littoralis]